MGSCVTRAATAAKELELARAGDPDMMLIRLDAQAAAIATRRKREVDRQQRIMALTGDDGSGDSAATRTTRLLHRRAIDMCDKSLALVETMHVQLQLAQNQREDAGIVTDSMATIRAVVRDAPSVDALQQQRDEFRAVLEDFTEFSNQLLRLGSPSETILGVGGDPAVEQEMLEEELALYEDVPRVSQPTRIVAAPRPPPPTPAKAPLAIRAPRKPVAEAVRV